jgi:hypothetical protein
MEVALTLALALPQTERLLLGGADSIFARVGNQ